MKISHLLDSIINDLDMFEPTTLSSIVRFVRSHDDFPSISILVRNSKKSSKIFYNQCISLLEEGFESDVALAGLLIIVCNLDVEMDSEMYNNLVSRVSGESLSYHWARGIATSYLLNEVLSEKIRKSA